MKSLTFLFRAAFFALALTTSFRAVAEDNMKYYSMLTKDGKRLVSYQKDGQEVFKLVPVSELPADVPPIREWKIYSIKSTHTDIGLHNSQYIQRHGSVKRIRDAASLVDADDRPDTDPAAYRYILEGFWYWHNYPQDMGDDEARRVVQEYFRRGRFDVGATCAGNHTHIYSGEELCRSIYTKRYFSENWGLEPKTMLMSDNPGISWSVVAPYCEAGVENIVFAPNQWNPIPSTIWSYDKSIPYYTWNPDAGGGGNRVDVSYSSELPMVFYWESPDAGSKLLVWASAQYAFGLLPFGLVVHGPLKDEEDVMIKTARQLARLENRYPYDIWLADCYTDDEPANTKMADFCRSWNEKWAYPQFCTLGDLEVPFDYLREHYGESIPTLRGEITSGWLQHAICTPQLLAEKFEADRLLPAAEALSSIAAAKKGMDYPAEDFRRAWWHLIINDEHSYGTSGYKGRRVFETWLQHRDWIRKARSCADRNLSASSDELHLKAKKLERMILANGSTVENKYYRLSVTPDGVITSIYDKELGRELLDGPANKFLYTRDNHRTWADPSDLGAEITQKVWLPTNRKMIVIDDSFAHASDLFNNNRYYRYGYYQFPFSVPDARFQAQLNGPVIDPYRDLTGHSTDAYTGVRDWSCVENGEFGVALIQFDSFLMEFGEIHPDKTCCSFGKQPTGKSGLFSYIFTDWLQMHNPDGDSFNPRFRYAITSYSGTWRDADIPLVARRELDPYYDAVSKYIKATETNVQLVALKAAEDGDGYIARFKETEGRATTTRIRQRFLRHAVMSRTDILENGSAALSELSLKPFEFATVRISNGAKVSFSAPSDDGYPYTGLVTTPCATHGEKDGQLYLEWGALMDGDFDHYELYRSESSGFEASASSYVTDVKNEEYEGIPYRVARYEDTGLKTHTRYYYRIRPVWSDGRKGDFSDEFSAITRLPLPE